MQRPGAGIADVYLGGSYLGHIDMNGTATWRAEKVFTWAGSATDAHTLVVRHRVGTGPIRVDALRSGVTTFGGQAIAVLTAEAYTGTATVASTGVSETLGSPVPLLLRCYADVRFDAVDVVITKTLEPTGQVSVGENVTFTLTYQNTGPVTVTNTYIDDMLKTEGQLDSGLVNLFFSRPPITVTPYTAYRWPLGSLGPGETGVITFGGTVDAARPWPSATVLTNTAVITTSAVDSNVANNTSWVTTTIVPGTAVTISLTVTPDSVPVGGSTALLRASARDEHGNPVPDGTPVTFTTNLGGFPTVQQRQRSTTNGDATITLTSGTIAGTATITASLEGVMASTTVTFTPLNPFTVTVTANPDHILVDGSTSIIEALVVDQYGNWVTDGTSVTFATSAGSIAPSPVATVNGKASTILTSGTVAGTAIVTATAGAASGTTSVVFEAGVPRVTIAASPSFLSVDDPSFITVTARDIHGNDVPDGTVVTFTTSLGNFGGTITKTTRTTVGGKAYAQLHSTVPGVAIVTGTVGTDSAYVAVTFTAGEPRSITLDVDPSVIAGCGGTATAQAVVKDQYGNLVRDGTVVVFDVTPQGDVEPINGGRTTNGVATAIVSSGTIPGPATVWAWPEQWRSSVVAQFSIVFLVGPPDRMELSAPQTLIVGGNQATIRLQVLDCAGYPVHDGTPVTFTLVSGEGSLWPQVTNTVGGWAYSTLTSPNQTGSATIRANAGDQEATVVVEYIPDRPYDIVLTADPLSIPADGVSTSTIGAEVKDRYGNAVADRTSVVFSTDLGHFETGASYTTSTVGGRASAILTSSTTAGMARVAAMAGGRRTEIYVDFYFVPTPTPPPLWPWNVRLPVIMKNYRH